MKRYPDQFMAFADLFAMGCLLHLQGEKLVGRKLVVQVLDAVAEHGNKMYFSSLIGSLEGNEERFAGEIQAHLEVNDLFEKNRTAPKGLDGSGLG
jgi:hypothetical protein